MDRYIVVEMPTNPVTSFRFSEKKAGLVLEEISSVGKYGFFTAYLSDTPVGVEKDEEELYHLVDWIETQGKWTYVFIPEHGRFHARNPQKILRALEKLGIKGAEEICYGSIYGQEEEKVYALMGRLLAE